MVDPKFNDNNHIVDDLKEEENNVSDVVNMFADKSNDDKALKEKMQKNLFVIAVVTAGVIVVLFILSALTSGRKSYSDVEDIMSNAAEKYYNANKSELPSTTGGTVEVSAQKLINQSYMKDLSKYIKKSRCTGKVVVENNDDNYIYVGYLDCGSDYKTTELFRKVTEKDSVVTTSDGLYSNNGEYVFKGERINNYVSINENLWRIVKVSKDNEVVLIKQDRATYDSYTWDDRYNSTKQYNAGINDFNVSRISNTLLDFYDNKENDLFTKNIKDRIVNHKFCIGKRSSSDASKDGSIECSSTSENIKIGMLTASEYMNASLDSNCSSITSEACQNYNYLFNRELDWWLITANRDNTYQTYYVSTYGVITDSVSSGQKKVRPVIYLNSRTMFISGEGTEENPYLIK